VSVFFFFFPFSLFFSTFSLDDSLWVNGVPWKSQLDESGLFYFLISFGVVFISFLLSL
jgi:hypothetical protein